jgi:hypothetical protein
MTSAEERGVAVPQDAFGFRPQADFVPQTAGPGSGRFNLASGNSDAVDLTIDTAASAESGEFRGRLSAAFLQLLEMTSVPGILLFDPFLSNSGRKWGRLRPCRTPSRLFKMALLQMGDPKGIFSFSRY